MAEKVHLFASQRVNRKARTDNEEIFTEKVSLITNQQMSIGKLADFRQLVEDMATAGITISTVAKDGNVSTEKAWQEGERCAYRIDETGLGNTDSDYIEERIAYELRSANDHLSDESGALLLDESGALLID